MQGASSGVLPKVIREGVNAMKLFGKSALMVSCAVLVTAILSVSAGAAETADTGALRLHQSDADAPISASAPIAGTAANVTVAAANRYEVVYQDQNGNTSTATVTAEGSNSSTTFARVTAGGTGLNVRQGPGMNYNVLCTVEDGTVFPLTGSSGGWYQVSCNGRIGYVAASYVTVQGEKEVFAATAPPAGTAAAPNGSVAAQIIDFARTFLGYPYIYGTAGPNSFDCSGLMYYVYSQFGYNLHRTSYDQAKDGVAVNRSNLQPGDLLFFSQNGETISHVGMYIGNNEMLHASTPTTGVIISDINSDYYVSHYVTARRVL